MRKVLMPVVLSVGLIAVSAAPAIASSHSAPPPPSLRSLNGTPPQPSQPWPKRETPNIRGMLTGLNPDACTRDRPRCFSTLNSSPRGCSIRERLGSMGSSGKCFPSSRCLSPLRVTPPHLLPLPVPLLPLPQAKQKKISIARGRRDWTMRRAVLPFILLLGLIAVAPADAASTREEYAVQADPICLSSDQDTSRLMKSFWRANKKFRYHAAGNALAAVGRRILSGNNQLRAIVRRQATRS